MLNATIKQIPLQKNPNKTKQNKTKNPDMSLRRKISEQTALIPNHSEYIPPIFPMLRTLVPDINNALI